MSIYKAVIVGFSALILAGCGGSGTSNTAPTSPIDVVFLSPDLPDTLDELKSYSFTVTSPAPITSITTSTGSHVAFTNNILTLTTQDLNSTSIPLTLTVSFGGQSQTFSSTINNTSRDNKIEGLSEAYASGKSVVAWKAINSIYTRHVEQKYLLGDIDSVTMNELLRDSYRETEAAFSKFDENLAFLVQPKGNETQIDATIAMHLKHKQELIAVLNEATPLFQEDNGLPTFTLTVPAGIPLYTFNNNPQFGDTTDAGFAFSDEYRLIEYLLPSLNNQCSVDTAQ